uniref:G-patch domain-containing protein n=1 Tax=Anopheles dirus TaxID=7168 RepID=A0A182NUR3_9DIPT
MCAVKRGSTCGCWLLFISRECKVSPVRLPENSQVPSKSSTMEEEGDAFLSSVMLPSIKNHQKMLCKIQYSKAGALYDREKDNVGARLMAKCGWSAGKGLGKEENGITAPVQVRYKKDNVGVGYAKKDDDEHWTQHDAGFNELLKRLNGEEDPDAPDADTPIDPKATLQSLEERSKKSRARVHYRKFTRGKDLSQVNEKDLANIFGKRALSDVSKPKKAEPKVSSSDDDSEPTRPILGLSTTNAGVSINDYFKEKMEQKRLKLAAPVSCAVDTSGDIATEEADLEEPEERLDLIKRTEHVVVPDRKPKKSKKRKIHQVDATEELEVVPEPENEPEAQPTEKMEKKKKSKKQAPEPEPPVTDGDFLEAVMEACAEEPLKKKKKPKKKPQETPEMDAATAPDDVQHSNEPDEASPPKKQKKTKKNKSSESAARESDGKDNSESPEEPTVTPPQVEPVAKTAESSPEDGEQDEEELTCKVKVAVLEQLDESRFAGSNFGNIIGYRLTEEVKLVKNIGRIPGLLDRSSNKPRNGSQKPAKWAKRGRKK